MFVDAVNARAYVRYAAANREWDWILSETLLPVLAVAAYVYVYRALDAPKDFEGFVILGGAMTAFWLSVLWSMASQFYWEKEMGNLELYMIAPVSRMAILLGMAIGSMFTTTTRAIAVIVAGIVLFGVDFHVTDWPRMVLLFALTLTALYAMGMMGASLFLMYGRQAWHTSMLLQEPVYLFTGLYFPVRALGYTVALGATIVPLTTGLDGLRQLSLSGGVAHGFMPVDVEIAIAFGLTLLFFWTASKFLRLMERLAKRDGRLTLKWQ
jgi:ABC-2 type transport system permease protein